jgi:hypothetical protein
MHIATPLPIFLIALILYFLFVHKGSDPEEKRRKDLAALAKKLRLEFDPKNDVKLAEKFSFLSWLRRGDIPETRYAYNTFHGYYSDYPITFFDYHFSITKYDYYWSVYILDIKSNFPDVIISPESLESRIAEAFGKQCITFESAEFSRTFRVRSSDKKFAFDICHPRLMEFLLANRDLTIEIRGTALAVLFEDWLRPEKVEHNLSRLIEIRKLLPNYLFEKPKH